DFSAIAQAGLEGGLELLGYASQSQFLVGCGITDLLAETPADNVAAYAPLAAQAHKLLAPAEMGELFKVIALGKGITRSLKGFEVADRSNALQVPVGSCNRPLLAAVGNGRRHPAGRGHHPGRARFRLSRDRDAAFGADYRRQDGNHPQPAAE